MQKSLLRQPRKKRIERTGLRAQHGASKPGEQGFKIGGADKTEIENTIYIDILLDFALSLNNVSLHAKERQAQKRERIMSQQSKYNEHMYSIQM